jgi:hypothetical protein
MFCQYYNCQPSFSIYYYYRDCDAIILWLLSFLFFHVDYIFELFIQEEPSMLNKLQK